MFMNTTQFKYNPDREIVHCEFTPADQVNFPDRIVFEKWCDEHGIGCTTYWNGAPYDVYGVTAELFVLFKMTWG
jgi:hypothetical protein